MVRRLPPLPRFIRWRPRQWWLGLADGGGASVRTKRHAGIAALGIAAAVACVLLPSWQLWRMADARVFDTLSTLSPPPLPADGPIVVAIDEPSFAELNLQWPWPRALHAELVGHLRQAGARAIGLDIIFAEPSASPEGDAALAAAMGPDVVLAADETWITTPQAQQVVRTEPMLELLVNRPKIGLASVVLDTDNVLRRLPPASDGLGAELLEAANRAIPTPPPEGALMQSFGPGRTYTTVSYYQALDPENFLPPDYFQGRVVVVGLSLQSAADAQAGGSDAFATAHTVRTGRLVPGAEVQAAVFDNLGNGLFIRPIGTWGAAVVAVLFAALGALAVWRATGWRTILWSALAVAAAAGGSFLLLRFGRVYAPPLAPALAFVLVAAAQGTRDFAAERRLRRSITRAFSQYVSPVIVERLAGDPSLLKLGGERRDLSILFCDVRGFTTISERLKDDPEGLTRLINRLLDPLSRVVIDHGGTIDKYIGDALMAFWNAPLEDPDHALHATRAGLAMFDALDRLNEELRLEAEAKGEEPLALRIGVGVNTGSCVVGNMGSQMRFDYSALGDAVNLASRLEGETKNFGVSLLVGPETARDIGRRLPLAPLDRIRVKGKTEPVLVSAVLPEGSDTEALIGHGLMLEDFWAGRLASDDTRLLLLAARLPALDAFYDGLKRRVGV
ncbi:MAG: adenylate/guanylate cyclase domain-containing protein [Mesorhizobium amorphae]|nr:MAG: adenylate/guanylate cyclase domain-containing protein [Mesorhizobium amorphae]